MLQEMPIWISNYSHAFAGWNLIGSFGSIVSVVTTWLFLYKNGYPWLRPQFYYSDGIKTLLNIIYNSLE